MIPTTDEMLARIADLQLKLDGCTAVNREQVNRLARAENELEVYRAKGALYRKTIEELTAKVAALGVK